MSAQMIRALSLADGRSGRNSALVTGLLVSLGLIVSGCSSSVPTDESDAAGVSAEASVSATASLSPEEELAQEIADLPVKDRIEFFDLVTGEGRTGVARKTAPVTAREAEVGEKVVSRIEGDGIETISQPAVEGDMVVRNQCEGNNEEILVSAEKFPTRYGEPQSEADSEGYRRYVPSGEDMNYVLVTEADGEFAMEAPWGEMIVVRPGDAVVQNVGDPQDIYRIYGPAFDCTYEIVAPAPAG